MSRLAASWHLTLVHHDARLDLLLDLGAHGAFGNVEIVTGLEIDPEPRGIVDGRSVDLRFTSGKWATLSTCPPEGSNRMAENWSR